MMNYRISKTCFKCGKAQPLNNFYRHPKMADGRLGKCKECTKFDVMKNYAENLDSIRAKRRQWAVHSLKHKASVKRYHKEVYAGSEAEKRSRQRWLERNRVKRKCHILVNNLIKRKGLIPKLCEKCGEKAEAHHEDYSKPLAITWLCKAHHGERHREINEQRRKRCVF
jgi:hypothetical protein